MSNFPKSTNLRATTALACRIAYTHPDRFNEAAASGIYPCAPKTTPGKARSFDVNDIIALRLYQRFIAGGLSAKAAGFKACNIRKFLAQNPEADQVYIVKTAFDDGDGEVERFREGTHLIEFDTTQRHADFMGNNAPDVVSVEVHNFHYLRGRIVHEINETVNMVGD